MLIPELELPSNIEQFGSDMTFASRAAKKVGERIIRGWNEVLKIEEKAFGDLFSIVDKECDEIVHELLKKDFPNDAVLSEEISPNTIDIGSRLWVIDPLDGSVPFLFRADPSLISVMISLREEGETQLSIVLFPLTGDWFYAVKDKGAYLNAERLGSSPIAESLSKTWVMMNRQAQSKFDSDDFVYLDSQLRSEKGASLVTTVLPNSGIGVRIMTDAWPQASVVIHDNSSLYLKQGPWDIIPIELIVREAGGVFLNAKGDMIDPFKPEMSIVASNTEIAREILALLS